MLRGISKTLRTRLQSLRFGSGKHQLPSNETSLEEFKNFIRRKRLLLKAKMMSKNKISFHLPNLIYDKPIKLPSFTWSELAGHGSFLFLACSYLESDFLNLRLFAVSGITLSIIFQYYREIPLWIPIRWNTLFLLINAVMIGMLVKNQADANNLADEEKKLYKELFKHKGMKPVDFHHLISKAKKLEAKKGDKLVEENKKNTRVYLVNNGNLAVYKGDQQVGMIHTHQFVGAMSYLKWQGKKDDERRQVEQVLSTLQENDSSTHTSWTKHAETTLTNLFSGYRTDNLDSNSENKESSNNADCNITTVNNNNNSLSLTSQPPSEDIQLLDIQSQQSGQSGQSQQVDEGHQGQADVICQDHCIVYYWKFRDLYSLIQHHPQLGLVIERSISEDLNKKMSSTWDEELTQRYKQLLHGAVMDGFVNDQARTSLQKFRVIYHISDAVHERMLVEFGWSLSDYERGSRASKQSPEQEREHIAFQQYLQLLSKHLTTTDTTLDDQIRSILRDYRQQHNITGTMHVEALKQLGWTLDDYETGQRELDDIKAACSQHNNHDKDSSFSQQKRGFGYGSISRWIFGSTGSGSSSLAAAVSPQTSSKQQQTASTANNSSEP